MDGQQIVFACGVVLILIILKNVGLGAPHKISVTADQYKEENVARNNAPKFPPFFFGLFSALAVQALVAVCDPTLLGTRYFPEDHLYTATDLVHSLQLAFTSVIFVPIYLLFLSVVFPLLLLVPPLFVCIFMVAYANSHRSWAWGLYFVTFLTWFMGSLFVANDLDHGLGGF